MTVKTYNTKLLISKEGQTYWLDLLNIVKDAFNTCARYVKDNNVPLSLPSVHNACYDLLRGQFPELPAQGVIRVQKSVLSAFRTIRSNKQRKAECPQKHSLSLQLDKRLYTRLTRDGITIPCGTARKRETCGLSLYPAVEHLFATATPKDPTIFHRNGDFYLSIPFEVATLPTTDDTVLGVDLGMKRLFTTSDGVAFRDAAYLKERRKLRYLKRCLQSKGTHSAKRHLKAVKHGERNLCKDMVERSTNVLIRSTDASFLVLEDLSKIKAKTSKTKDGFKRNRHNNALSQVPFYMFKERLTHKAQLVGKRVETVSPTWTSQTDCRSGKRDGQRKGCRYYCIDGIVLDADWNAAVNIAHRSSHPSTNNATPLDGMLRFLDGRALSTAQSSET
jgi:IS605 OrfB family transposase